MAATPALPANAPSIGKGRYVLVARIGEGGMAGVYRAWDKKLRVWRAVKVLLPEFARRKKVRVRFESEAHTMARLEHDHLVRIYDVGDAGELPFLVMELVSGGTLQSWTRRHGPMPPRLAVDVTLEFASGVLVAHAAGIVHRDIKPQNVLVAPNGTCKLTDFGIAHVDDEAMTRTGSVLGTLGYMAPEQRNDAKSVDQRADVYSIGATLWHLLTAEMAQDLFLAVDNSKMLADVAEPLRPILARCFAYEREGRFPDVRALVAALEAVRDRLPESPVETPELVQDTTEEEVAVEVDTDFEEIQALLDAAGIPRSDSKEGDAPKLVPPATQSKAPLPYFMPQADKSKRRKPSAPAPDDPVPDWIDQESLSSRGAREEAVIGVDVPVSKTPYMPPDRATRPEAPPEPPKPATVPPPEKRTGTKPARTEAPPAPAQPETAPAPSEEGSSVAQRLVGLAAIPVGIALAGGTVLVLLFAVGFFVVASGLQDAERATVESRGRLYQVLQDDRMIVDELAVLGADRGALEGSWVAFMETKGEPARSRAALSFLEVMEGEARRANVDQGASVAETEASHTLRRIHSARQAFEGSLAEWDEAASAPQGRVVILLGGASAPR